MLVSNLVCIFSNFDYDNFNDGVFDSDGKDPESFLDNFNGIQISLENLFLMEKLEIKHRVKS
jgi:hypothetical protein